MTKDFHYNSHMLNMKYFGKSHTGENLHDFLYELLKDWGMNQIDLEIYFVTDNAPNITKAINLDSDWNRIPCFAHTLQLSIDDATKPKKTKTSTTKLPDPFGDLKEKCKDIVSLTHRSDNVKREFFLLQKELSPDTEPLCLIQDVDTRWNCTHDTFERILILKKVIILLFSEERTYKTQTIKKLK